MATATGLQAGLAYDVEGTGTPVVFLHRLTFDRRTWRPITGRLDGSVTSIAIDLPAHGDSGGEPTPLEAAAERIHQPAARAHQARLRFGYLLYRGPPGPRTPAPAAAHEAQHRALV